MVTQDALKNKSPSPEAQQRGYIHSLQTRAAGEVEAPDKAVWNGLFDAATASHEQHVKYGPQAAVKVLDALAINLPELAALLAPPKRKRLVHASELANLPPVEYIAGGELVAGGLNYLYGPSGAYKSFIVLDRYALPVAQHNAVIYVAGEGASGYAQRVKAACQHHGMSTGQLHFWLEPVMLMSRQAVDEFIAEIQGYAPKLVIFDTLATCSAGGDIYHPKDAGVIREHCREITRETGAAVLVIHHTGKDQSRGMLGSLDFRNSADMVIQIKERDGYVEIVCDKAKDAKPFDTLYVRPEEVYLGNGQSSLVMLPTEPGAVSNDELTKNQRTVLQVLITETMRKTGGKVGIVAELAALGRSSVYSALNGLMRRGLVKQHEKGDPFYITETGEEALKPPKIVNLALPGHEPPKRKKRKAKANPFSTANEGAS